MFFGEYPGFEREARGEWGERDEERRLADNERPGLNLLPDNVAEYAAFLQIKVTLAAFDLLLHLDGHDREGDELRMRVLERCSG